MKTCYDNGQTAEVSWSLGSLPAAAGELPPKNFKEVMLPAASEAIGEGG